MGVHSFPIFDRKRMTLFAKRYAKADTNAVTDEEQLEEQQKLVFGMLFSLREFMACLSPQKKESALHLVQTGASTIHNYETSSGLRVHVLFIEPLEGASIRTALEHVYSHKYKKVDLFMFY